MTITCINSTTTFQTQNGPHFAIWKYPNEAYNDFIEEYLRIYDACFLLKVLKGKQVNRFFSPWLSPGLLKSVNNTSRLYRKFVTSPSTSSVTKYNAYKKQTYPSYSRWQTKILGFQISECQK